MYHPDQSKDQISSNVDHHNLQLKFSLLKFAWDSFDFSEIFSEIIVQFSTEANTDTKLVREKIPLRFDLDERDGRFNLRIALVDCRNRSSTEVNAEFGDREQLAAATAHLKEIREKLGAQ